MHEADRVTSMFKKSALDTKMNDMAHASIQELPKNVAKQCSYLDQLYKNIFKYASQKTHNNEKVQTLSNMSRNTQSKITDTQHATQHVTQYTNMQRNNTQQMNPKLNQKTEATLFLYKPSPAENNPEMHRDLNTQPPTTGQLSPRN